MPIFEYKCNDCSNIFELFVLNKKENNNLFCTSCGSKDIHKIISPVGVIFKGSGFYITDSKKKASTSLESSSETKVETDTTKKEDSVTTKKEDSVIKKEDTREKNTSKEKIEV